MMATFLPRDHDSLQHIMLALTGLSSNTSNSADMFVIEINKIEKSHHVSLESILPASAQGLRTVSEVTFAAAM
jgi:hypothetical protein